MASYDQIYGFILDKGSDNLVRFGGKFEGGIHLQKDPHEMATVIKFLEDTGKAFENYLEIGAAAGGSVYLMNKFLGFKNTVILDNDLHPKCYLQKEILDGINYSKVVGNSHDQRVLNAVKEKNMMFDVILIDTDVRGEDVEDTLRNYVRLLRAGGYFVMHNFSGKGFEVKDVLTDIDKGIVRDLYCYDIEIGLKHAMHIVKEQGRLGIAVYEKIY